MYYYYVVEHGTLPSEICSSDRPNGWKNAKKDALTRLDSEARK
jgi:hypothetical protein